MQDITIRPVRREDHAEWRALWDGYNAFYGRVGPTAVPESVTARTWEWFFDPAEAVFSLVAERGGRVHGLANYLFHRSTSRPRDVCYLQDLYTAEHARGHGVARRLIESVVERARTARCCRVYWQTHGENRVARHLYDAIARHSGFIVYARDL